MIFFNMNISDFCQYGHIFYSLWTIIIWLNMWPNAGTTELCNRNLWVLNMNLISSTKTFSSERSISDFVQFETEHEEVYPAWTKNVRLNMKEVISSLNKECVILDSLRFNMKEVILPLLPHLWPQKLIQWLSGTNADQFQCFLALFLTLLFQVSGSIK